MDATTCVMGIGVLYIKNYNIYIYIYKNHILREPCMYYANERERYVNSILYGGESNCVHQIQLRPRAFFELCDILTRNHLIRATYNMSINEQVFIFLHIIGHNVRLRVVGSRFFRSIETVYIYFKIVLKAILRLHKHMIKSPSDSTPPEIRNNTRFHPYFQVSFFFFNWLGFILLVLGRCSFFRKPKH